jgi:hypothetical protein
LNSAGSRFAELSPANGSANLDPAEFNDASPGDPDMSSVDAPLAEPAAAREDRIGRGFALFSPFARPLKIWE